MNTQETQHLLRELAPQVPGIESTPGRVADVATLRMTSIGDQRSVVIESPGDWWYSVSTEAGYARIHADQGLDPRETRELLSEYVQLGLAYLQQGGEVKRTGWLRVPKLIVNLRGKSVVLERPVATNLANMLRKRPR